MVEEGEWMVKREVDGERSMYIHVHVISSPDPDLLGFGVHCTSSAFLGHAGCSMWECLGVRLHVHVAQCALCIFVFLTSSVHASIGVNTGVFVYTPC